MTFYKKLLKLVQILVVLVVLPRVASFISILSISQDGVTLGNIVKELIALSFAGLLGLGVISTAYFSERVELPEYEDEPNNPRERKRREKEAAYFAMLNNAAPRAEKAMFVFAFLDGSFNLADAIYSASAGGLFDPIVHGQGQVIVYVMATIVFGVAPTMLSIVLTRVVSLIDRIPDGFDKPAGAGEIDMMMTALKALGIRAVSKSQSRDLLRALPTSEDVRSGGVRSGIEQTNIEQGIQERRVFQYLDAVPENVLQRGMPSINEIADGMRALSGSSPARSTISLARNKWLRIRGGK